MKNISFALTTRQFRERTKFVTRRLGWKTLRPGEILMACEKCQGLKKGEHPVKLGAIRVTEIWHEPLHLITEECGATALEGFPEMTPQEFVEFFCEHNGCTSDRVVTRIRFEYL